MIAYLEGVATPCDSTGVIINVQGVGYEVNCVADHVHRLVQAHPACLWIYTHVRESEISLYGFLSQVERKCFVALLKVNGIGPKLALQIIGAAPIVKLAHMIRSEDIAQITQLPRVGRKIAEQMVLALKNSLDWVESDGYSSQSTEQTECRNQIASALINLGFKNNDVQQVVDQMPLELDFQAGVVRGLSQLSQAVK